MSSRAVFPRNAPFQPVLSFPVITLEPGLSSQLPFVESHRKESRPATFLLSPQSPMRPSEPLAPWSETLASEG